MLLFGKTTQIDVLLEFQVSTFSRFPICRREWQRKKKFPTSNTTTFKIFFFNTAHTS